MALVAQPDVETALLRPLTTLEATYIAGLIAQTEALLRQRVPSIDARIAEYVANPADTASVSAETVATVLAGVIKRYLINPEGAVSISQAAGPFSTAKSYALRTDKTRRGALEITDEDVDVLFPNRKRLRAGTIKTRAALAPRPVGRYGPLPTPQEAVEAVTTYSATPVYDVPYLPTLLP